MKTITRPNLKSAVKLSAREMNALRFSQKHTVLTPEQLENITASKTTTVTADAK